MQRHPVTRSMGWVGLIVGSLLILVSCGDDSGSISFPTIDDPDSGLIDTPPDPGDVGIGSAEPATGADRSADLFGSWRIVNYTLSDDGGMSLLAEFVLILAEPA